MSLAPGMMEQLAEGGTLLNGKTASEWGIADGAVGKTGRNVIIRTPKRTI
jgi:hypothetical protein